MALHEVLIYVCWIQYKIMLFVYAWVLIELHHHQASVYLLINLLYTYDAKNSLYNIVWNYQLPLTIQHTILFLIVNLKGLSTLNPTRSPLWAFDSSRNCKPLDLRKRMYCTAQFPSKPPWLLKRPQIDFSMHDSCKESTPAEIFRAKYWEICDQYQDYCKFYTNGSMSGDQVGSAAICGTTTKTVRLPNGVGIFRAELCAVTMALNII